MSSDHPLVTSSIDPLVSSSEERQAHDECDADNNNNNNNNIIRGTNRRGINAGRRPSSSSGSFDDDMCCNTCNGDDGRRRGVPLSHEEASSSAEDISCALDGDDDDDTGNNSSLDPLTVGPADACTGIGAAIRASSRTPASPRSSLSSLLPGLSLFGNNDSSISGSDVDAAAAEQRRPSTARSRNHPTRIPSVRRRRRKRRTTRRFPGLDRLGTILGGALLVVASLLLLLTIVAYRSSTTIGVISRNYIASATAAWTTSLSLTLKPFSSSGSLGGLRFGRSGDLNLWRRLARIGALGGDSSSAGTGGGGTDRDRDPSSDVTDYSLLDDMIFRGDGNRMPTSTTARKASSPNQQLQIQQQKTQQRRRLQPASSFLPDGDTSSPSSAPLPGRSSNNNDAEDEDTSKAGPKLVVAGKMTVDDGPCNVAEMNLDTGQWMLKERIQLSLYNSYSGGDVYYMLPNHTLPLAKPGDGNGGNGGGSIGFGDEADNGRQSSSSSSSSAAGSTGDELILVGAFDTTYRNSQVTYCSVGKWDGDAMSKVGEGLCNSALSRGMKITTASLAGPDDLFVAGSFHTQVWNGDSHEFVKIFNIAHYDAADQVWMPLRVGQLTCSWCTVTVLSLAWDSNRRQLHVGGKFNAIDGANIPAGLAIYDMKSGHLVAHPGGGLSMKNVTQDGVATSLQLDEESGVVYVMGSFDRLTVTGEACAGLAAYEIDANHWTCLADEAHSVLPSGGGNMLLTPFGLMVAGKVTSKTTWPDASRPYTIALLKATLKAAKNTANASSVPQHDFEWSWLPGFDGWMEPIHTLANGFGAFQGVVFVGGDNLVAKWYYETRTEQIKSSGGGGGSTSKDKSSLFPLSGHDHDRNLAMTTTTSTTRTYQEPVTVNLSLGHVRGVIMAIAQLNPPDVDAVARNGGNSRRPNVIGYTIVVYCVALGAVFGMLLALLCNRSLNSTIVSYFFDKDANMKGISLDTLTYSAVENTNVAEAYQRAMRTRFVQHPHLLTLIDPQEIILHRIIGEGTFGRVWSARWRTSSVAVKEFVFAQAAVAGRSQQQNEIVEEIIGEAGMMAILRHPNVLQLYGCSLTAQAIWIVSELCSLGSLRQLLDDTDRELTTRQRIHLALQVAGGMDYLHTQDPPIIHRDLKSHNILCHEAFLVTESEKTAKERRRSKRSKSGRKSKSRSGSDGPDHYYQALSAPALAHASAANGANGANGGKMKSESTIVAKIGDWGSARATLAGSRTMTHGVGTACWLAPEVITHARSSKKSDVYGFGIILWELATRQEVYQHLEPTQIIARVANDNLRPKAPKNHPLNDLMKKCWSENPKDRPSFDEIVAELQKLLPTSVTTNRS